VLRDSEMSVSVKIIEKRRSVPDIELEVDADVDVVTEVKNL
jgi:hypothetical protein